MALVAKRKGRGHSPVYHHVFEPSINNPPMRTDCGYNTAKWEIKQAHLARLTSTNKCQHCDWSEVNT